MLGKWWWWTPLGLNIRKQGLWNIVAEQVMIPFTEYINCSPALAWSRQLWCMTAGKYSSFESHRLHISTHDFNPHWYQRKYLFQNDVLRFKLYVDIVTVCKRPLYLWMKSWIFIPNSQFSTCSKTSGKKEVFVNMKFWITKEFCRKADKKKAKKNFCFWQSF